MVYEPRIWIEVRVVFILKAKVIKVMSMSKASYRYKKVSQWKQHFMLLIASLSHKFQFTFISYPKKVVKIGILQQIIIALLLWNLVLNKIRFKLNNKGTEVVDYLDDFVFFLKRIFVFRID